MLSQGHLTKCQGELAKESPDPLYDTSIRLINIEISLVHCITSYNARTTEQSHVLVYIWIRTISDVQAG